VFFGGEEAVVASVLTSVALFLGNYSYNKSCYKRFLLYNTAVVLLG